MIKYVEVEFAILLSPVNGKQGAVAQTNKKLEVWPNSRR